MSGRNTWVVLAAVCCACGDDGVMSDPFGTEGSGADSSTAATTPATGEGSGSADATGGTTTGVDGSDEGIKLDVAATDIELDLCGCALTYIWISNSDQGTVSKLNTRTLVEEGRYITRPDGVGNPSRTSVSLSGDVAVANRHGGLVKFYADTDKCSDTNGLPGIQTSQGADDILPWEAEECRAWYTEFPTTNQRPVAWTQGTLVRGSCESTGEKVWTVTSAVAGFAPGTGGAGGVIVYLVDGDSGAIEQTIPVDEFSGIQLGAYGGAVDGEGNLYFSPMGGLELMGSKLARVDIDDFSVEIHAVPQNVAPYGITVDHFGKVWVSSIVGASAGRFDPETMAWDVIMGGFISAGGLQEGLDNLMWVATETGASSIDVTTLMAGPSFTTNQGGTVKGISIDVDGYVWAVNNYAFKVDASTGVAVGTYMGLTSPYTYSDMTGWALLNATCPPAG